MGDGYFSNKRNEMLDFIPKGAKKILDAGCAEGEFGMLIKQRASAEVWGIEIDKNSCRLAEKKLDKVIHGSLDDKLGDLPESYFDCIIFNDVLEHMIDPWKILKIAGSKLSSTGEIVVSIPNILELHTLIGIVIKKDWNYSDSGVLDRTHLRFFTKKSIIRLFEQSGFEIKAITGINGIKSWKFLILNMLTFGFFSEMSFLQFACVAKPKK
jgi:2-polyprenyl-3-methyl-5-hydroxy-6-metoxy-1,4-benzoquinol methylase